MESTIISFLPYDLTVPMASMIPSYLHFPKVPENAPFGDFNVFHVPDCTGFIYQLDGNSIRTVFRSEEVSGAICRDHISASYAVTDNAFPGLKAIPGLHEKEELKAKFPELIEGTFKAHKNWYSNLVKLADDIWSDPLARGKNRSISDTQRIAAKSLGLNKDWINTARVDQYPCPACTNYISELALICPNCHTIVKPDEYKKMFNRAPDVNEQVLAKAK